MSRTNAGIPTCVLAFGVGLMAATACAQSAGRPPKDGATIQLGDWMATIRKLESLPYVESEFTKQSKFDSFVNPKRKELRERQRLDEVVSAGRAEFDRPVLLLDRTHRQFKKLGQAFTNGHRAHPDPAPEWTRAGARLSVHAPGLWQGAPTGTRNTAKAR